jgi:hypothetical protein
MIHGMTGTEKLPMHLVQSFRYPIYVIVRHLFLNAVNQEHDNTIVNYYVPSSSKALSSHENNAHQTKAKNDLPSSFNM